MDIQVFIIGTVVFIIIILLVFLIRVNLMDKKDLEVFLNKNEYDIDKEEGEVNDG